MRTYNQSGPDYRD